MTTTTVDTRITTATAPNGTVITFQTEPKRVYTVNGTAVPSVTEVLSVLEKGGLSWWGMGVGVDGVLELIRQGRIAKRHGEPVITLPPEEEIPEDWPLATKDGVIDLLKQEKLTVNNTLTKAGNRGVRVHDALEAWAEDRTLIPDPEFYPEEEQGYIEGLRQFLTDLKISPRAKIDTEIMVGSVEHGFAGRYDLSLSILESEFVVNRTPIRGETREVFPKGRVLFDLKSAKGVYDSHHLQLAAYELAAVENGHKPTAYQAVVRVDESGYYTVTRNKATAADFLAVKSTYDMLKDLKGRKA